LNNILNKNYYLFFLLKFSKPAHLKELLEKLTKNTKRTNEMSSQTKVTADKKTPKKAVGGKKEVEGDSLKKIETKIVELNENTVELDELE